MCYQAMTITDTALVHYSAPALAALLEAIKRACEGKSGTAGVKKNCHRNNKCYFTIKFRVFGRARIPAR